MTTDVPTGFRQLPGEDIEVGDELVFLGTCWPVRRIDSTGHPADRWGWRTAISNGGWKMTLIPNQRYWVVED